MIVEALLIIALGVAAGVVAGLFGVGGGVIFVPTLTLVLGLTQLEAEATSLLAIVPVAILGSWRQTREGTVRWADATIIGVVSLGRRSWVRCWRTWPRRRHFGSASRSS